MAGRRCRDRTPRWPASGQRNGLIATAGTGGIHRIVPTPAPQEALPRPHGGEVDGVVGGREPFDLFPWQRPGHGERHVDWEDDGSEGFAG